MTSSINYLCSTKDAAIGFKISHYRAAGTGFWHPLGDVYTITKITRGVIYGVSSLGTEKEVFTLDKQERHRYDFGTTVAMSNELGPIGL